MLLTPRPHPGLRLLAGDRPRTKLCADGLPFRTKGLSLGLKSRALLWCHVADALAHDRAASDHAIVSATIIGADACDAGNPATLDCPFATDGSALAHQHPALAQRLHLNGLDSCTAPCRLCASRRSTDGGANEKRSESE